MFFYLGQNCELLIKQSNTLFTDLGWKTYQTNQGIAYFKGYCLDYDIEKNILNILNGAKPQGIWCVILNDKIFYPEIRPFPLYKRENELTNLRLEGFEEIDALPCNLAISEKDLQTVVSDVTRIVTDNIRIPNELNIWFSGGVDSGMLIALAEHANIPYTIHVAKLTTEFNDIRVFEGTVEEYKSPLLDFCRDNYWAYEFLSNFKDKVITTGFYGDEYFFRSIWQIHLLASAYNKTGLDFVKPNHYVYRHITKDRYKHLVTVNELASIDNVKFTLSKSLGATQVWHIDNTLTFCPLLDKRIAESVLSLDIEILLNCALDATIQKEIIKTTHQDVLMLLDTYKNTMNCRKNFFNNLDKVNLLYCTEVVVH